MHLGEEGTEQFTVTTRLDGKQIGQQEIHDPFIRTSVRLRGFRHAWNALTKGLNIQVAVNGTHGAMRAVMTLDPYKLQDDTEDFLRDMAMRRAEGYSDQNGMSVQ
jgi:hypothetical protein